MLLMNRTIRSSTGTGGDMVIDLPGEPITAELTDNEGGEEMEMMEEEGASGSELNQLKDCRVTLSRVDAGQSPTFILPPMKDIQ